jgi:phosphohistidine phosphatase
MKIYLVRHGDSVPHGLDDDRVLSEKGKEDIKRLAQFITHLNIQAAHIVHSAKYRTQETAELLLSAFQHAPDLEKSEDLNPESSIANIIDRIQKEESDWVLISHQPFLNKLVSHLCIGKEDNNLVLIKPGSMICLEQIQHDHFTMGWMVNPKIV